MVPYFEICLCLVQTVYAQLGKVFDCFEEMELIGYNVKVKFDKDVLVFILHSVYFFNQFCHVYCRVDNFTVVA